jgi:hypothetical protein
LANRQHQQAEGAAGQRGDDTRRNEHHQLFGAEPDADHQPEQHHPQGLRHRHECLADDLAEHDRVTRDGADEGASKVVRMETMVGLPGAIGSE